MSGRFRCVASDDLDDVTVELQALRQAAPVRAIQRLSLLRAMRGDDAGGSKHDRERLLATITAAIEMFDRRRGSQALECHVT
jgi:hypothetical protein